MSSARVSAAPPPVYGGAAVLLTIGFNKEVQANNDRLVPDAIAALEACGLTGGEVVVINGPASLPVTAAIAHKLAHIYATVAGFDPKMSAYIVAIAHGPAFKPGDVIPASEVES